MANIEITASDTNVYKVRQYLFDILDNLLSNTEYEVNANFLSNDINNYSIDRIPVNKVVENWIIPTKKYREVYEFRSRNAYGFDIITNIKNTGFFEAFEDYIYSNNKKGILPIIDGIETIQCLNCGAINIADTNTAEFSVQIEITYIKEVNKTITSL